VKNLLTTLLILTMLVFMSCGDATEVGNPTDIPTTITGVIETATIPDGSLDVSAYVTLTAAINPEELTVVAISTDFTEEEETTPDEDGNFSIIVYGEKTYELSIEHDGREVGPFSFEQDDAGDRANRIRISSPGTDVNLGPVNYEDGGFRPTREPRHHGQGSESQPY
jgi:hypothetical protein